MTDDLALLDPARPDRFADGSAHALFRRLRAEAPIHRCEGGEFGSYWSITRHADISAIENDPDTYSSSWTRGGISIIEPPPGDVMHANALGMVSFITMDPPDHAAKRRVVAPAFTPSEMQRLAGDIRRRTVERLESLPRGAVFDWVSDVSVPLTTDMLAILFDFPWEERAKLRLWSDAIVSLDMIRHQPDARMALVMEMAQRFLALWQERLAAPPALDLLSMMIHSDQYDRIDQMEFVGNMALLIVGGNDTTRNSMSALAEVIGRWPDEWAKVVADPTLALNVASEVIRWQSPAAHMRRTVTRDTDFQGQRFAAGDKIVLWYLSGNRDEGVFPDGDRFIADRPNARRHLSFGHGIHRCVGARLAELQIGILIEEMVRLGIQPQPAGAVVRDAHPFISSISAEPVILG
ncbi:cytochrome [alpha proteobacterium AAP81b]|nr:cytochrome [alpha proteobacterium AAP81b]